MSTITKLDPRVRRARADRRDMIVGLQREPSLNAAGALLHRRLELIRRNPRHNGTWKQAMAEDATNRFLAGQYNVKLVENTPT